MAINCVLFLSCLEIELEFQTIPPDFPSADSVKDIFHDLVGFGCLQVHVTLYTDFLGTTPFIFWC